MKRFHFLLAVVMIGAFLLTACGGAAPGGGNDLLSTVKARTPIVPVIPRTLSPPQGQPGTN
jgi:predicted small secreted protein